MAETQKVSLGGEVHPSDPGYQPPAAVVPLPSKGKVYPPESPLHGVDGIEIRSMTAKEEDILTSRALLKQGKAISTLLQSCIVNKSIDPEQMLVGDRNAVLVAVRITGYGPGYETEVTCPACEEKSKHEFDLSSLPIKELGEEPVAAGTNCFVHRLSATGREVRFKLLTGADEQELSTALDRSRKALGVTVEPAVTARLSRHIVSLAGETDRAKLAKLVRDMPARESRELRAQIERISPGIQMNQEFVCPACSAAAEVEVPLGTEFFWPQA